MRPRRRIRRVSVAARFALAVAVPSILMPAGRAHAQQGAAPPVSMHRLFPSEADVSVDRPGLARLDLPPEVLGACRVDLSDLRLFDRDGREVPFLVDRLAPSSGGYEMGQRFMAPLLNARREEVRRTTGPPLRRETYEIGLPAEASRTGFWTLVLETGRAQFVCRADVEALPAAGPAVALVANGSFFRLFGTRGAEKLRLPLPEFTARSLRLRLESEEGAYMEPAFRLEGSRILERPGRISVPLEILSMASERGATVLELARPAGIAPDLLRIDSTTGTFDRRVEVRDKGQGINMTPLGEGTILRVRALTSVEQTELAVNPARGERLSLRIDDGDSPPLEGLSVTAIVSRPSLVFEARPDRTGVAATLRFGGGRARPPRYDLAGLLPAAGQAATGRRALAAALLFDPASVARATIGPIRSNPDFDRTPALAFAMRPAAPSQTGLYSHRRTLEVTSAPEGLSRLRLAPADLALLREDLADLRVVDGQSRQWPYLLERDAGVEWVALRVEPQGSKGGVSHYRLAPPQAPLKLDGLRLDAEAPFFDRDFRLSAEVGEEREHPLISSRLARKAGEALPVETSFPAARVAGLDLFVGDGDDAPLVFRSAMARVSVPDIYLAAPAGSYALLMGAPEEEPPRYELARVRDVVLAVASAPARAGELSANPEFSLSARLARGGLRQQVILWGVLCLAVLFLAGLTLWLARREAGARSGSP